MSTAQRKTKAKKTAAKTRGSTKLKRGLVMDSNPLPAHSLEELVALTKVRGVKLQRWWIKGQPRPDALAGTVQVKHAQAAGLIEKLIGMEDLRLRLDIFPYGIPNPDVVVINFETHQV